MTDPEHPGEVVSEPAEETAGEPRRTGRKRKLALRVLASLVGLVLLVLVVLNSPIGHRFVVDRIKDLAPASGLRIEIGRIEGSLYAEAVLHDLTLSDPKGPFLKVPRVELDWRPFNWFFSGLDVRRLVAQRGTLLRLPELNPGDPDAPLLPEFDIRIDRFELQDFTVAQGVVGKARKVDLIAQVDKSDKRTFLRIDGDLGAEDRLYALLDVDPRKDRFDLELDYNAPAGGLLAGLVGAEKDLRARIVGDGKWSAWKGAVLIEQANERLVALRLTNREGTYAVLGQAYPARLLDNDMADVLVGRALSIGGQGTLENSVLDGALRLRGEEVDLLARGAVDLDGNAVDDLAVTARIPGPVTLGEGLSLRGGRLAARLDGKFRDLAVRHELALERLDAGVVLHEFRQEGTLRRVDDEWTLPLDISLARLETGTAAIDPKLVRGRGSGTITLSGAQLRSDDLRLAFPDLTARLALRGDTARGGYALAGPVTARGLALQDLGAVDASAKILFKIGSGLPWTLRANLAGRMAPVTNDTLANIAGAPIGFRASVALGGGRPLLVEDARLSAPKLSLALDGRVEGDRTTLAGSGRHADYGAFTIEAAIAGDGPRAELVFASPLPAAGLKDVRVALAPIDDGFRIETDGGSLLGPFDGVLDLYMPAAGPTRMVVDRMTISQTGLSGELAIGDGGVKGTLALAGGGLDGTVALAPRGGGQGIDVSLQAENARFGGATPTVIRRARIEAQGVLGGDRTEIQGSIYAQGIGRGRLFIGQLAAKANVVDGQGDFTASIAGRRGSRFNFQLTGGFAPERLTMLARGDFAGKRIAMPRRAVLTREAGGWRLAPTQISYGDGIVLAEGRFGGNAGTDMTLKLSKMPLSLVDVAIVDMGLGGRISGVVTYRAAPGELPVGSAKVELKGLTRSGLVLSSRPIDAYLVADLAPREFEARAVIREGGERRGRLQAQIAGMPGSGDLFQRLSAGSLFVQLRYDGPADALWRLAAIDAFDLTGPLRIAADFTGTLTDPQVRGSLSSSNLRLQSSLTGTDVRAITARGTFAGSRLNLSGFSGTAPNGGRVSGSGTVDLADLGTRGPRIDLKIAASNAAILKRRDMAATVTGPLRIVSDGIGGTIAGRLRIAEARWRLGGAAEVAALPDIATREINVPADIAPPLARGRPWRFLIDARTSSGIAVRGMGLDSEWGADIRLRGTTDDPRIGGNAQVVRGDYEFAGTRFELTRGRIAFDESVPIDPRLDIVAETDIDGLNVRVIVKGNAQRPEISFSSIPALPEEEILARLLFGGSITELSATDALQLGAALASLRGGGGMGPINKLRSAIGLDRLRIVGADPALGTETAVAAGKNIGKDFYVEIITDGRGYSATEVEFRITSWLSLLGSVSTLGRESVVFEVSKDY